MLFSEEILGYQEFTSWCKGWPSFHDSEIVRLDLNRSGASRLVIDVLGGPKPKVGPRSDTRHVSPPTGVAVTFVLQDIEDIELAGFSSQNVIFGLSLEKEQEIFRIAMDPCFGMSGTICAKRVSIEFTPSVSA